ncbi:hypothetical protein [Streptomyces sp. DSM 118878]
MTLQASVRWTFRVEGSETAEQLATSSQSIMDALLVLEQCNPELLDSGVAMDAGAMTIDVEMTLTGASAPEIVKQADVLVRTAIHSAEHATPGWPPPGTVPGWEELGAEQLRGSKAGAFHTQQFAVLADA